MIERPFRFRAEPHAALRRALVQLFACEVESLEREDWASLTLRGCRHRFRIGDARHHAADDALDEHEFTIPGHLVAEIAVVERHRLAGRTSLFIEALTVCDD